MKNFIYENCPFCGHKAKSRVSFSCNSLNGFYVDALVECASCGVEKRIRQNMFDASFEDYERLFDEVIKSWNQRLSEQVPDLRQEDP